MNFSLNFLPNTIFPKPSNAPLQNLFCRLCRQDLAIEYGWGCRYWGVNQAKKWVRDIKAAINNLKTFPESRPLAPENGQFQYEVRQLIFQRYRVLYTIIDSTVYVMHIRGPYIGEDTELDD